MTSVVLYLSLAGVFVTTGVSQLQGGADNLCPLGFTLHGESCYAYMQGKQEWADAEQICVDMNAHLVEIFTHDELQFVQNLTRDNGNHDVWLGAHDLIQEGLWVWGWSGSGLELTSWKDGEPNDGGDGDEECMEMGGDDLLWNDDQCDNDKHFICQLSANGDTFIG